MAEPAGRVAGAIALHIMGDHNQNLPASTRPSLAKVVLGYLRCFVVAAEKGSFRQAANDLGVWESTTSRGIRDLEDEIGVARVIRHPSGAKLTNASIKFVNHARMAIGRIEYALKDAGAVGRGEVGRVRIAIFIPCFGLPRRFAASLSGGSG